jgi:hypothetical protein
MAEAEPVLLSALVEMGFEQVQATQALVATGSMSVDLAVTWILNDGALAATAAAPVTGGAFPSTVNAAQARGAAATQASAVQRARLQEQQAFAAAGAEAAKVRPAPSWAPHARCRPGGLSTVAAEAVP